MAIVTINDYNRLVGLLNLTATKNSTAMQLYAKLEAAKKISAVQIDRKVVTMHSKVLLRETNSGRESDITITYPHEAEHNNRLISVLSPIGVALLGRRERDVVSWKIPGGVGEFEIVEVTYQPEAAGDYHL